MAWVTYLTASPFTSDRIFRTESEADSRISKAGAFDPPLVLSKHGSRSYRAPREIELGVWVYSSSDSDFVAPSAPASSAKRTAAGLLVAQLRMWRVGVLAQEGHRPRADVDLALDYLTFAEWAGYLVANSNLTDAQVTAWVNAVITGAADITTPTQFFERVHTISDAQRPTGAVAWANPNDAAKVNLADAESNSATWFNTTFLASVTGADSRDLFNVLADSSWVNDL